MVLERGFRIKCCKFGRRPFHAHGPTSFNCWRKDGDPAVAFEVIEYQMKKFKTAQNLWGQEHERVYRENTTQGQIWDRQKGYLYHSCQTRGFGGLA